MKGRLASSGSVHECEPRSGTPYVMHPRHKRDTFRPVAPSLTYSMRRGWEGTGLCQLRKRVTGAEYFGACKNPARFGTAMASVARHRFRTPATIQPQRLFESAVAAASLPAHQTGAEYFGPYKNPT